MNEIFSFMKRFLCAGELNSSLSLRTSISAQESIQVKFFAVVWPRGESRDLLFTEVLENRSPRSLQIFPGYLVCIQPTVWTETKACLVVAEWRVWKWILFRMAHTWMYFDFNKMIQCARVYVLLYLLHNRSLCKLCHCGIFMGDKEETLIIFAVIFNHSCRNPHSSFTLKITLTACFIYSSSAHILSWSRSWWIQRLFQ